MQLISTTYKVRAITDDEAKRMPRPALEGQRQFLETLVDDWTDLTIEERKRLVAFVFEEIRADVAGVTKFRAKDDWRRYMTAVVGVLQNGGVSERKTGLKEPDVATVRLVADERGWLRLAS